MLRPSKHSHPDKTVINVAMLLLQRLKTVRIEKFDDLKHYVKSKIAGSDILFLPALNFLYLFGVIEYRKKTDCIEYNEAI